MISEACHAVARRIQQRAEADGYNLAMRLKMNGFWLSALTVALAAGLSAQAPRQPPAAQQADPQNPTFTMRIDPVTNDVSIRHDNGNLVPDLQKDDDEIFEDGIQQAT